jgi:hypothetical protein
MQNGGVTYLFISHDLRCPYALAECRDVEPQLVEILPDHFLRAFESPEMNLTSNNPESVQRPTGQPVELGSLMDTGSFARVLPTLFNELIYGSPEPHARTYVLNQGDEGLLASLARLSATAASATHHGSSIAAHVDHLRYGLSLLNRWATGTPPPWPDMDWTVSWRKNVVSDVEWRRLRDELRREADAWVQTLRKPREANEIEVGWMAGSVAHLAYHIGAIRQIDRATRGPTAEDEARVQDEPLRS